MIRTEAGPYLFDTSAESWFGRSDRPEAARWIGAYLRSHEMWVSAVTVTERVRGYSALARRTSAENRGRIEDARINYLKGVGRVIPLDTTVAIVAGEIMALLPEPPTPPKRSHRLSESRAERLARWRFDGIVAATALTLGVPLIHNNPIDFEAIQAGVKGSRERFPGLGLLMVIRCGEIRD